MVRSQILELCGETLSKGIAAKFPRGSRLQYLQQDVRSIGEFRSPSNTGDDEVKVSKGLPFHPNEWKHFRDE